MANPEFAVDPLLRQDLVEPIIAAATTAIGEMTGVPVTVRDVNARSAHAHRDDICVVVEFSAATEGALLLHIPPAGAAELAQRMLVGVKAQIDDVLIRDCMGELANVIAGQAKALLAGGPYHFSFRVPRVLGAGDEFRAPARWSWFVIDFDSDGGSFTVSFSRA